MSALVTSSCLFIFAGENNADAYLHSDPDCVFGHPLACQAEPLLIGTAFLPHSHHPTADVHDRPALHSAGDEMRKFWAASPKAPNKPHS